LPDKKKLCVRAAEIEQKTIFHTRTLSPVGRADNISWFSAVAFKRY